MRRSLFLIMALMLATPALGTVVITCNDEDNGVVSISYNASTETELVRAFALDVSVDSGATIEAIDGNSFSGGEGNKYGIFPGTIDLTDPNNPDWNSPIAPSTDPGAEGTGLGTNRVILEMGSLYDPDVYAGPATSGQLCKLQLDLTSDCNVAIVVEPTRGGIVMEDGSTPSVTSGGCSISGAQPVPPCWLWLGQCHGDTVGDDLTIDLSDFQAFKAAFGYDYPNANYDPCADYDRSGTIDLSDFQTFKTAFQSGTVPGDCTPGGTWPPS